MIEEEKSFEINASASTCSPQSSLLMMSEQKVEFLSLSSSSSSFNNTH
jgi:histidinol phosphatase-like PHP family hydrolase